MHSRGTALARAAGHGQLAAQLCHFVFQLAPLIQQHAHAGRHIGGLGFQLARNRGQNLRLLRQIAHGIGARQRLDPAHPGAGCAIAQQRKGPNIAGARHMGAAAQLDRIGLAISPLARASLDTHRYHAHLVAVFFAKQRLRTQRAGIIRRHDTGADGGVLADKGIHLVFHLREFIGA